MDFLWNMTKLEYGITNTTKWQLVKTRCQGNNVVCVTVVPFKKKNIKFFSTQWALYIGQDKYTLCHNNGDLTVVLGNINWYYEVPL